MTPLYDWVTEQYHGPEALGYALFIASATCIFSLVCAFILALLDLRRTRIIPQEQVQQGDEIKLTDALHFPFTLWLVFIICVCFYSSVFPFISLGKVFFISKFDFEPATANTADRLKYILIYDAYIDLLKFIYYIITKLLVLYILCLPSAHQSVVF